MNGRSTFILVLIALALGGWIFLTEHRGTVQVAGISGTAKFRKIVPRDVLSVEILRSNVAVRVERTNGGWWLRAPINYPAQPAAIDGLLETLGAMVPRSHISSAEIRAQNGVLAAFGLETPDTITIHERGGIIILKIGARTPLGNQLYFQQVGEDGVFTADASLLAGFPSSPEAWRDRRLFNADTTEFDRIEMLGRTEFEAVRETNGVWSLIRPLSARANADQIHRMLIEAADTQVTSFVTDSPGGLLGDYGLAKPVAQLVLKRGTNEVLRLQVGRASTNAPGEVFVRRTEQGNIVRATNSFLELLTRPLATYRDRRLLPSVAGMTRLEVTSGTNRFALDREGTNWFVASPKRHPADAAQVREVLRRFVGMQIQEFADDLVTDASRYGLDQPPREYAFGIRGSNGAPMTQMAKLQFGNPYSEGRRVYVRRSDETSVYGVSVGDFVTLPVAEGQFRDWTINPTNVVRVDIRHKGRTRVLSRNAAGKWEGASSTGGVLIGPAIEEGLYRIGQAPLGKFPGPQEAALKQFGFDQVDHTVTVTMGEGGSFRTLKLQFGGRRNAVNQFVLATFDDDASSVLTEFPLGIYQDFIGPWFGIAPESGDPKP
jgi:hypothetical protein